MLEESKELVALKRKIQKKVKEEKRIKVKLTKPLYGAELDRILAEIAKIDRQIAEMVENYTDLVAEVRHKNRLREDDEIMMLLL